MTRTLVGLTILIIGLLSVACGGTAPPGATGAAGTATAATSAAGATSPAESPAEASSGGAGGLPANELTVEQLCSALTAEELGTILGQDVTIDPAETEWCGYDLEDGSAMFVASNNDTAEEFIEQAEAFDCDALGVEGGAVVSSCGADKEEGRPSEVWFLLDGVGVQFSANTEMTADQYVEAIRSALN